ncbi:MAG: metal-dependent transcriptional regulator [Asgard group archaeon]|nr:metal-dependent transcriptional regulator [Asgard group archaeon]
MLTTREEEYIQIIARISEKKGYAKVKEIAEKLDVSYPSVSEMLNKLKEKGYLDLEPYTPVTLTPKGKKKFQELEKYHEQLTRFLVCIRVDEEIAFKDACKVEHYLNEETLERLSLFMDFLDYLESPKWLENFQKFIEGEEVPKCSMKNDEE